MKINRKDFFSRLGALLRARNPRAAEIDFDEHTDLIREQILDSFGVTEVILFVEEYTGRPIRVEDLTPTQIMTMELIYHHFVAEEY